MAAANRHRRINPCVHRLRKELNLKKEFRFLPNLPRDVVVMILQKLPFKSLMRFRCVCKSWNALFSDPLFMKARNRRQIIVTSFECPWVPVKSMDIEVNSEVPGLVEIDDFPRKGWDLSLQILGSCDGLLLSILDGKTLLLYLWNPSTKKFRKLPAIGTMEDMFVFYGFGYDELHDDYKVVRGNCFHLYSYDNHGNVDYSGGIKKRDVHVYSRRSNSWKHIGDCPYNEVMNVGGAFVDGFCYWLVIQNIGKDLCHSIGCFDLAEEKFKTLPQPRFNGHMIHLGVLEGFLCVVCNHYKGSPGWTIWVMKETGVIESWTKLMKIPLLIMTPFVIPLCITKIGEIVMQLSDRKIIKYNPKTKMFEYLVQEKFEIESSIYTESSLSPFIKKRKPTDEARKLLKRVKW